MIVRERATDFVMIEQDNHAQISGEIISKWDDAFLQNQTYRPALEYAVYNHDIGWKAFDSAPFWNDEKQAPYTFIDFPTPAKLVLYKHGIDYVAQNDTYAALLCSEHYTRFMVYDSSSIAKKFVQQEKERQHRIRTTRENFNEKLFDFHYKLLQLCDNLSLYMCLNTPGTTKKDEHPFFKDGISFTPLLNPFDKEHLTLDWLNQQTISMDIFPFVNPLSLTLKQKVVCKNDISKYGLIEAYQATSYVNVPVLLT